MEPHPRRRTSLVLGWVLVPLAAFAVLTLLVRRYPENTPDVTVLRWAMSWWQTQIGFQVLQHGTPVFPVLDWRAAL